MTLIPMILALALLSTACRSGADSSPNRAFATRQVGESVSFNVTPIVGEDGRLVIELRANTHSGDLATLNLKEAISLKVGEQTYTPVEAGTLSGHHASAKVVFEPEGRPEHFSVTIRGVRDMGDLNAKW